MVPVIKLGHDFYFDRGKLVFPPMFNLSSIIDLKDLEKEDEKGVSSKCVTGFEGLAWSIISRLI